MVPRGWVGSEAGEGACEDGRQSDWQDGRMARMYERHPCCGVANRLFWVGDGEDGGSVCDGTYGIRAPVAVAGSKCHSLSLSGTGLNRLDP